MAPMPATAPAPGVPKLENLPGGPASPGVGARPKLSSEKRAGSAPTKERPPPPITPRNRKASRSLFRELEGTVRTMHHAYKRTECTLRVVKGVIGELHASVKSAEVSMSNNARMVAGTKETKPGMIGVQKKPTSPDAPPGKLALARPLTEDEVEILKHELRDKIEEGGEERDATEDEITAAADERIKEHSLRKEIIASKSGICNKPIVDALEKLRDSSRVSAVELQSHERTLAIMLEQLQEIIDLLTDHKDMRDSLFDPLLSTDLKWARAKGIPPIKRSVLYQKMNFVPKNKDGSDLKPDWNDKDQESGEGKRGSILDEKGHVGLTAHQATFCAAEREDLARAQCNAALKVVRNAKSTMAQKKSQLQVSVLDSRQLVLKQRRAMKMGKFGTSGERTTDPATRKCAANPEDEK